MSTKVAGPNLRSFPYCEPHDSRWHRGRGFAISIGVKSKSAPRVNPPKTVSSVPPSASSPVPAASSARQFTHDEIADRARTIWDRRGRPEGQDAEIWYQAESELKQSEAKRADDDRFANKDALLDKDGDPNDQVDQRLDELAKPRVDRSATSV